MSPMHVRARPAKPCSLHTKIWFSLSWYLQGWYFLDRIIPSLMKAVALISYLSFAAGPSRQQLTMPPKSNNLKKLSHSLSAILRHRAIEVGLTITPDGYVVVEELLGLPQFQRYQVDDIHQVVRSNDKQRFKLSELDGSPYGHKGPVLCIRANQGHSIDSIDPDLLMEKLSDEQVMALPMIVHGTYRTPWEIIQKQGLKKMNRTHIHFATGLANDGVISGMRRTSDIYIYIDAEHCVKDGITFYRSDNGVILTDGVDGQLEPKYFAAVTDNAGNYLFKST